MHCKQGEKDRERIREPVELSGMEDELFFVEEIKKQEIKLNNVSFSKTGMFCNGRTSPYAEEMKDCQIVQNRS